MLPKELLPKRVADELESVRPNIGEDLVAHLRVAGKQHEFPNDIIGGYSERGRFGVVSLLVPELLGVSDETHDIPQERQHQGRPWCCGFLLQVFDLLD